MFFWMLVEGIYIYLMVVKVFRGNVRRRRKFAFLVGWGKWILVHVVQWLEDLLIVHMYVTLVYMYLSG